MGKKSKIQIAADMLVQEWYGNGIVETFKAGLMNTDIYLNLIAWYRRGFRDGRRKERKWWQKNLPWFDEKLPFDAEKVRELIETLIIKASLRYAFVFTDDWIKSYTAEVSEAEDNLLAAIGIPDGQE